MYAVFGDFDIEQYGIASVTLGKSILEIYKWHFVFK